MRENFVPVCTEHWQWDTMLLNPMIRWKQSADISCLEIRENRNISDGFSLAVEKGIRLTRIYEYYVETMDTSYQRELPKPLLMYFTYNNTSLADDKKAFIYASIVGNRGRQPGHMRITGII